MNSKHILIPLDLVRGPATALVFAQQMALENVVSVTLLHVIDLNIAPAPSDVYTRLCAESQAALRKLAKLFFGTDYATRVVVRVGQPADEIIAEAKEGAADMIVLCGPKSRKGLRLFRRGTIEDVLHRASCPTVVLPHPGKEAAKPFEPQERALSEEVCAFARIGERAAAA
jgi:nucleotide-binding universal stress UspA family protein